MKLFSKYTGILIVLLFAWFLWQTFQDAARVKQTRERVSVPIQSQNGSNIKAELNTFEQIEGTDILRSGLYVTGDQESMASYKSYQPIQNYIFFDATKKTFYFLKPNDQGLLLSTLNLTETFNNPMELKKIPPVAFAYLVADQDTNNDKRINQDDLKKIAISDASGLRFKVLIDQVDKLNGTSIVKNNHVFLFYISANKLSAAEVDLRSQEIISTTEFKNQP